MYGEKNPFWRFGLELRQARNVRALDGAREGPQPQQGEKGEPDSHSGSGTQEDPFRANRIPSTSDSFLPDFPTTLIAREWRPRFWNKLPVDRGTGRHGVRSQGRILPETSAQPEARATAPHLLAHCAITR